MNWSRRAVLAGAGGLLAALSGRAIAQPLSSLAGEGDLDATTIDLSSASSALRRLYAVGGAPLWSDRDGFALDESLRSADRHGLDPKPYLSLIQSATSASERDLNRSMAALAYAGALSRGLVNPSTIFDIYTLPRDDADLVEGLRGALELERVGPWLNGLAPGDPDYLALSAAYVGFVEQSRKDQPPPIAAGPSVRIGDADIRRTAILAALLRERPGGQILADAYGLVWTQADADLLKGYQRSRGLRADGVVGPNTLAMLNATPRDKARRIAVNLERLRWLQRTPPPTRIDVNTAASTLRYFVDGVLDWTAVVVPGRPGNATPQLQASFDRLVVNPPWYVPASIARREITPQGPAYLKRHHMRRVSGRIIQSPGPWAALGLVKFDMQNRYAIYLHDTPSKDVFLRSQRHLSHGCVRVSDAVGFARRLAAMSGVDARFDRVLASGRTGIVPLAAAIPVRLIYQTALVGDEGTVTFRPDVYGWDRRAAAAMGMEPPAREGVERIAAAPLGP